MGIRNRERIQRLQEGKEVPLSVLAKLGAKPREVLRLCGKCKHVVPESRARQHIRDCWKMDIGDDDPIPKTVPQQVLNGGLVVRVSPNRVIVVKEP